MFMCCGYTLSPSRRFWRITAITLAIALCLPALASAQSAPNDPLLPEQWALPHIGAECSWRRAPPNASITIAVLDSGVDLTHPDLVAHLRRDGFDFIANDDDPSDEHGHGTHVTGIIAAQLNNNEGIAGLTPNIQILPVRVMDAEGFGSDRAIAQGIDFAIARGARVINLSLGATLILATRESSPQVSRAIRRALDAGVIVVAAAGNDFVPLPNALVADNDEVIVVAASSRNDTKAAFTNTGPWIDVVAPGERILSTMPTYPVFLTSDRLPPEERFQPYYDYMSGTSQAAPHVTALAALLLAVHPDWGIAEVTTAIKNGAADIYQHHPTFYRRLQLLGAGRIDVCQALEGRRRSEWPLWWIVGGGALAASAIGGGLVWLWRRRGHEARHSAGIRFGGYYTPTRHSRSPYRWQSGCQYKSPV